MTMPATGPREKEPSSAGRSDTSSLTKLGISTGMGISMYIRAAATADSIAVTARVRAEILRRGWGTETG